MKQIYYLLFVAALLLPYSCIKDDPNPVTESRSLTRKTADYEGRVAHEWMRLGFQMIKDNFLFGPHAARTYGYMGLTVWESVYGGIPNARSLAGQINEYPEAAFLDTSKEYDWDIVLCHAMKTVLPALMDNITAAQRSSTENLALLQETERMKQGISEDVRQNSKEYGIRIGQKIVDRIQRDGRDIIKNIVPVIPTRNSATKWYWDATTYNQSATEPLWGTIRTFVISNSQACEAEAPLMYSENKTSAFYREAKEVYDVPKNAANKTIAYHWDNGPGRTCSPACHWVSIAQQILERDKKNLAESAKVYALVGFAAADAFSSSWYLKYKYFLMRPATYIREQIDPKWDPILGTPPYPDYTSGSSTIGGAAPIVLASVLGDGSFVDKTHLGSPLYTPEGGPFILPERNFPSLTRAGEEQAESRILGGVHFRRACNLGLNSGRCIGNSILARIRFE